MGEYRTRAENLILDLKGRGFAILDECVRIISHLEGVIDNLEQSVRFQAAQIDEHKSRIADLEEELRSRPKRPVRVPPRKAAKKPAAKGK